MTDETPKPKRKRLRWIIAGVLLLVVVSTIVFWMPPRIDQRFVGRWTYTPDSIMAATLLYDLKADGTGNYLVRYAGDKEYLPFRDLHWKVDDSHVVVHEHADDAVERIAGPVLRAIAGRWNPYVTVFNVEASDGQLRLRKAHEAKAVFVRASD